MIAVINPCRNRRSKILEYLLIVAVYKGAMSDLPSPTTNQGV